MKRIITKEDFIRNQRKQKIIILISQIAIISLFFSLWELLAHIGLLNVFLFSKPSRFIQTFFLYAKEGLFHHVFISSYETIIGLLIGTTLGILCATILYFFKTVQKIMDPFLTILNALPKTALGPLIIIILGTSHKGIIGVCVSLNLIITIISSLNYFCNVDPSLIKMMKVMGANRLQILFKVIYPSNLFNLFSLLKVNIGLSWIGTIVGEFLVSKEGIGYLVVYGSQVFKMDLVMMGVIILCLVALVMYGLICVIEKMLIFHKEKKMDK
ncbi:MAG: ABC transporter permease [Bacilli bacterium]